MYNFIIIPLILLSVPAFKASPAPEESSNIAKLSTVKATSTCKYPQEYCELSSITAGSKPTCHKCGENNVPRNMVDSEKGNTEWISTPISQGERYIEVNVTFDFGQAFDISHLQIKMGHSPRPSLWVLESSSDNATTWNVVKQFARDSAVCMTMFGNSNCDTESATFLPLQEGEISVNFNTSIHSTNIMLRFLSPGISIERLKGIKDEDIGKFYYYAIRDVKIYGRESCSYCAQQSGNSLCGNCGTEYTREHNLGVWLTSRLRWIFG